MSLWKIAWRSIQQRGLASTLTCVSMGLGVMLVVSVLSIFGVVKKSFESNSSLGYNMIMGATKGGRLQLTLNTVYYLSQPVENVPYDFYMEFMSKEARDNELQYALHPEKLEPGRAGRYAAYTALAIPVCLGDYFGNFRVVGTVPDFFDKLKHGPDGDKSYAFSQGRNFQRHSAENGFFECVVGATVATEKGVTLGYDLHATHGDPDGEGHGQGFKVVGILDRTGTPNDRAVFVNMDGFYLMEDHAKPLDEPEGQNSTKPDTAPAGGPKPLPIEQREITSLLVRTINPLVTPGLQNSINESSPVAQAVLPVQEIYNLFEIFVSPIQWALLIVTGMICVVSGVSILVSIFNSMSERRQEIAVMRALGADRMTVTSIIMLESIILVLLGGIGGWIAGHALNGLASPEIEARTGVPVGFFDLSPGVSLIELVGGEASSQQLLEMTTVPWEFVLIPLLIVLAIVVGIWPAVSAYHTDVSKSLGK